MATSEQNALFRTKDSSGNSTIIYPITTVDNVDGIDEKLALILNNFLEVIYPVGSIYLSVSSMSPSTLFGGTWEQIKDSFLLAAGDNYAAGDTGGEAEHTLTVDEIPTHNHKLKTDINNPTYNITWPEWFEYTDGWTQEAGETQAPATHTTSTGGDMAHNNMPPYIAVYMWKRIA